MLGQHLEMVPKSAHHMVAACVGELAACLVRVPVEIVKQRRQANASQGKSMDIVKHVLRSEGFFGLYRGFTTTVLREVPFALLQMPLWEHLKQYWADYQASPVMPWQSALCGALAGGKYITIIIIINDWIANWYLRFQCGCDDTSGRGQDQNHVGPGRVRAGPASERCVHFARGLT